MFAELILLGKLLGKSDLSKSTFPVTRPKLFGRDKQVMTRPTISKPQPKTKQTGPALGLKKYF